MMKYLDGEELSVEDIKKCIRKGTLSVQFFPVLCGTALGNKCVKFALDAVIDYMPSPTDIASIEV
jgi:elongation factor G